MISNNDGAKKEEINSIILMLGILGKKLDEIVLILDKFEKKQKASNKQTSAKE